MTSSLTKILSVSTFPCVVKKVSNSVRNSKRYLLPLNCYVILVKKNDDGQIQGYDQELIGVKLEADIVQWKKISDVKLLVGVLALYLGLKFIFTSVFMQPVRIARLLSCRRHLLRLVKEKNIYLTHHERQKVNDKGVVTLGQFYNFNPDQLPAGSNQKSFREKFNSAISNAPSLIKRFKKDQEDIKWIQLFVNFNRFPYSYLKTLAHELRHALELDDRPLQAYQEQLDQLWYSINFSQLAKDWQEKNYQAVKIELDKFVLFDKNRFDNERAADIWAADVLVHFKLVKAEDRDLHVRDDEFLSELILSTELFNQRLAPLLSKENFTSFITWWDFYRRCN